MRDNQVGEDLNNDFFESVVAFGKAMEEKVQVLDGEVLKGMVSIPINIPLHGTYLAKERTQAQTDDPALADHCLLSTNSGDDERVQNCR